jgi:ribonuclease R
MKSHTIHGIVKRHPDGFGFVLPQEEGHPDVFISREDMQGVMSNDQVEVEVFKSPKSDRFFGKVVRITTRAVSRIVGKFEKLDNGDGRIVDGINQWGQTLKIPFRSSRGAIHGDLVAAEITQYPMSGQEFVGRVVEIIGDANDPLNDIKRVLHLSKIPKDFPTEALREADLLPDHVLEKELAGRKDLRQLPLITIDGVTAKDFDDAVYVTTTSKGFQLWVAIADVSHYVRSGTPLDESAYERGTSVYYPNFVVPMLPEKISNELCSLKPNVDRLSFVCEMHLSFQGEVESAVVYEAVIHSHARVTYGEAQDILNEDVEHSRPEVTKNIRAASDLAKILMAKRFREGSLEINVGETQVVVDEAGNPTDIIRSQRVFAHRLIEELMLIANVSVAKILNKAQIPALYRIHETPDKEDIESLQKYLHNFGSQKKLHIRDLQKKLTKSLQDFENKPEGIVLNIMTLRSMKQAKYSHENIGHFGLGFEFYTHFTSPIRRYPDLIVHRLLKSIKYNQYKNEQMSVERLVSAGTFLSACEQRAVKSERLLVSIKKARFMEQHLGEVFEGVVSSVVRFGIFVLLKQFDVDGLVKVENLGNDQFEFDEENLILRGKKTGLMYRIGDSLKVQVAQTNTIEGQIDFVLEGGTLAKDHKNPKSFQKNNKKRFEIKKHIKSSSSARLSGRRTKKSSR